MDIRIQCLYIDTGDPAKIASFWESALGLRRTFEEEGKVVLEPPEGSREHGVVPDLLFLKVPEGKAVKNRLHLDLRPGYQPAGVARLEALGARRVDVGQGEVSWVVMADPDGNEFDVLRLSPPMSWPAADPVTVAGRTRVHLDLRPRSFDLGNGRLPRPRLVLTGHERSAAASSGTRRQPPEAAKGGPPSG